jgi:antitoxin ParD1/3/4
MPPRYVVENREMDDAAKLEALRATVNIGIAAIDRGDAKEFPSAAALVDYLKTIAAKARAAKSEAV